MLNLIGSSYTALRQKAKRLFFTVPDHILIYIKRFKIPRYVFFVENYPLTSSGKIQKYLLREMGAKKLEMRNEE